MCAGIEFQYRPHTETRTSNEKCEVIAEYDEDD
jgi:hypothetical protein